MVNERGKSFWYFLRKNSVSCEDHSFYVFVLFLSYDSFFDQDNAKKVWFNLYLVTKSTRQGFDIL